MINDRRILAVVPARSGSKGIPDKNMRKLDGKSLIALAGECLAGCSWIDRRVISTDSETYAEEGAAYGLAAPFLRPPELSGDRATAIDAMRHALRECERHWNERYEIFMLIEPTSPMRTPDDLAAAVNGMINGGFESVVCVSPANTKSHPLKMLTVADECLRLYDRDADRITARQQLETLYVRNGACYGVCRDYLLHNDNIIGEHTFASVINRELVNIDDPIDLEWAEFLLARHRAASASFS